MLPENIFQLLGSLVPDLQPDLLYTVKVAIPYTERKRSASYRNEMEMLHIVE